MEKIFVDHAYDGFLYAPIFLAHKLGLFPANCELKCTLGDAEAIQALCDDPDPDEKHWFAICDPLSDHLQIAVPSGGLTERICLVATIINAAPVWLFNINPEIGRLASEADLEKHRNRIHKIITYPPKTTGFLFGERIRQNFLDHIPRVTPVPFGEEFNAIDLETLVVTSDMLRVVKENKEDQVRPLQARTNPIIFSYPDKGPPETKQFLFTGLLTRRKVVLKENLDVLMAVMGAIKKGIHYLTREHVHDDHVSTIAGIPILQKQLVALGFSTAKQQQEHVRETLRQMRDLGLYWESLTPNELAFNNAEKEWAIVRSEKAPDLGTYMQHIPSLLLFPQRLEQAHLRHAIIDRMPDNDLLHEPKVKRIVEQELTAATLSQPPMRRPAWYDLVSIAAWPVFVAFGAYAFLARAGKVGFSNEPFAYLLAVVSLIAMLVLGAFMAKALYKRDLEGFTFWAGACYVGALASLVGALQLLQ